MSFEQDGFAGHTKLFFRLQKHDSHRLKMIARNLTLDHSSNRGTLLLPVLTASYVSLPDSKPIEMLGRYHVIATPEGTLRALDTLTDHEQSRRWLEDELAKPYPGKTVANGRLCRC